jgi:hypothetical protein
MQAFVTWLKATPLSLALQAQGDWLWPLSETLHFIGLCLVIGIAGLFDVRLLGWMKKVPFSAARALLPWAIAGLMLNLVTGLVFIVSDPQQYLVKGIFWAKVTFLVIAGVNAFLFEWLLRRRTEAFALDADTPNAFKLAGMISLIAWFGVLICGRLIPFLR